MARITRPSASDIECDEVAKEQPDALQWPRKVMELYDNILEPEEKQMVKEKVKTSAQNWHHKFERGLSDADELKLINLAKEVGPCKVTPLMLACRLPESYQASLSNRPST